MAFYAYIFEEDHDKLRRDAARGAGGSLYGQWTSTGNPVVHVAISDSGPQREEMATLMCTSFMLCHIGEWRAAGDSRSRQNLLSKYKGSRQGRWRPGAPSRFLVLEVNRDGVTPFLFVDQVHQGQGKLEKLEGENPFNRRDVLTKLIGSHNQPTHQQSAAAYHQPEAAYHQPAAAGQANARSVHTRSQSNEADTRSHQWYARDSGNEKVTYVFKELQKIARQQQVDMSRDTITHDMSMSFTDSRNFKKWVVKFPSDFPFEAASLLVESSSPVTGYTTSQRTISQPSSDKVEKALGHMIHYIKTYRP